MAGWNDDSNPGDPKGGMVLAALVFSCGFGSILATVVILLIKWVQAQP